MDNSPECTVRCKCVTSRHPSNSEARRTVLFSPLSEGRNVKEETLRQHAESGTPTQLHLLTFGAGKKQETPSSLLLLQRGVRVRHANQPPSFLPPFRLGLGWDFGVSGKWEGRKDERKGERERERASE